MKILLVDDHAVVRQGYASLLRAVLPEVQVSEACDGEQALAQVQLEIPSLIIMDIGLPGISGLETLRRLRQRLPQIRVLFFSMHDELPLVPLYRRTLTWVMRPNIDVVQWPSDVLELRWVRLR